MAKETPFDRARDFVEEKIDRTKEVLGTSYSKAKDQFDDVSDDVRKAKQSADVVVLDVPGPRRRDAHLLDPADRPGQAPLGLDSHEARPLPALVLGRRPRFARHASVAARALRDWVHA